MPSAMVKIPDRPGFRRQATYPPQAVYGGESKPPQIIDSGSGGGLSYNQMVVDQLRETELDRLFQAFADSTRRDIVRRVTAGEYSVSGLAGLYAMSFAAVQKHVAVLERASLVTKERRGREQIVRGNHEGLQKARRLLDDYEAIWRQRVSRIADILAEG
jgi:DNA-binding transcriptional ArsR family regulator